MMRQNSAIAILCCYARKDKDLLYELKKHLSLLERENVIDVWYDGDISAGTEWDQDIKKHLNEAHIILLLVSPDFINSDYCYSTEMKRAMARHGRKEAIVIPVIVRPVAWQHSTLIGHLQALPEGARPVATWRSPDEAWKNVVEGIYKVLNEQLLSLTSSTPLTCSTPTTLSEQSREPVDRRIHWGEDSSEKPNRVTVTRLFAFWSHNKLKGRGIRLGNVFLIGSKNEIDTE
jgi:hypothetical protein